ncbi:phage portal protein family protein [Pseudomonas moraviensis]
MSMYDRRQHARLPVGERQRFIVARQDATYANPYGFPDLSMCFWPATFMRGGLKFWVQFTEKYGSPWVIGKHPRGANDEETDLLLDSLEAMVQDAVAAIPDDASVQIIEAAGKAGSADVYRQLLEYCRSEINVAMLGQNQTTEKDSNRASATAGVEVTHDIRESGVQFTNVYWQRTYNLQEGDLQKTPTVTGSPAFSEYQSNSALDQHALDQAINGLPANVLHQHSQHAIAPLIAAFEYSPTDADVLGQLAEANPHMDTQALEQHLAQLIFIANTWGHLSAIAEGED